MKAAVITRYGSPDVIKIRDAPKPAPGAGEVLIRVHATTVNRTDCGELRPRIIGRLLFGRRRPRRTIFGMDFAGVVEAVRAEVMSFKPGDRVFGMCPSRSHGAQAEYVCIPESGPIAMVPANTHTASCRKMLRLIAVLVLIVGLPAKYASAQPVPTANNESSVTLYGGGRFGGSVMDPTTNSSIDLKNGSSFGLSVDIGLDRSRQVELFYSQQDTTLTSGAFSPQSGNNGLTLHNYHIGGTAFIDEIGSGVYVMGGIGGTTATPKGSGLNSETFFSGNLGVGWMLPLAKHVGFRFEARGYGIALRGNGSLFCGGAAGCTATIKGKGLYYGEVLAGVALRF